MDPKLAEIVAQIKKVRIAQAYSYKYREKISLSDELARLLNVHHATLLTAVESGERAKEELEKWKLQSDQWQERTNIISTNLTIARDRIAELTQAIARAVVLLEQSEAPFYQALQILKGEPGASEASPDALKPFSEPSIFGTTQNDTHRKTRKDQNEVPGGCRLY